MRNKKGALNLSIQAIVIIVLAMTLLGLGLGFVRGIFENLGGLSSSTFGKISEQLNTDLITSDDALLFSKTQLTVERGSGSLEGFGVRNDGDLPISYGIKILTIKCPAKNINPAATCTDKQAAAPWFSYIDTDGAYRIKAADRGVEQVEINVPRDVASGKYLVQIVGYQGKWPTDGSDICKDFTLNRDTGVESGCLEFGQTTLFLTVA